MIIADEELSEEQLFASIDKHKIPQHIAIIMDGNGRWAKQRGYIDRIRGHRAGMDSVKAIVRACGTLGVKVLTLYAFSRENWARPKREIAALMHLLEEFLASEIGELNENKVRLIASGRLLDLPSHAYNALENAMVATSKNTGLILNLALSYGGRTEIIDGIKKLIADYDKRKVDVKNLDERAFTKYLYKPDLPDPDLLIRTSGEMRISNFLLWEIAYTEIYVTPILWPDFRRKELFNAVIDYQKRERRFGKIL